jgi:aspartate carbamoyltransferase catalytic subunit
VKRHLLEAGDLDRADATLVLDTAAQIESALAGREVKKLPTLRGRTVVNLFYEDSTRTRISFELAAKRLSADVINFSAKGSSVSKGESLKDTALTLEAMGSDAIVVRHQASGAPHRLANWVRGSVVNAGDGTHEHPTQALLDAYTIRHRLGPLGDDAIVMHPGPMNRGMEIAAEVADSVRSTIVEQVGNGVSVRMAVLYLLLGGNT